MIRNIFFVAVAMNALAGCAALRPASGPDAVVGKSRTDLAVALHVHSTVRMLQAFGHDVALSDNVGAILDRVSPALLSPRTPERSKDRLDLCRGENSGCIAKVVATARAVPEFKPHVIDYLSSGYAASTMLCRSYLRGLSDRNSTLEAIQRELGVVGTLASLAFEIFKVAPTADKVTRGVLTFVNNSIDNYQEFAFLQPQNESIVELVIGAQTKLRDFYIDRVLLDGQPPNMPISAAEAIAAMYVIEQQCTRSGIRSLIDKSVRNSALSISVQPGGIVRVVPSNPDTSGTPTPK